MAHASLASASPRAMRRVALARAPPRLIPRAPPRGVSRPRATPAADASGVAPSPPPAPEPVRLDGMRKECARLCDRQVKKVGKATTRVRLARETLEALERDPDPDLEALERCPDVDALESDLADARDRLARLRALAETLSTLKSVADPAFASDARPLAIALGVGDAPPPRPPRPAKKRKQKPSAAGPRKPYWTFVSADGVDIRVGRTSSDNDEVSCDPKCRDAADWWMHAAGCPGSHVVIRYAGDDGPPTETLVDAATLAAAHSKATQTGNARVSLVRCRQVSKPRGAKPGLVQLSGEVRTVTVCVKDEAERLERLRATKS